MPRTVLLLLPCLAACGSAWAPVSMVGEGAPEVYLTSPPPDSIWPAGSAVMVSGMVLDDLDAPEDVAIELYLDGTLARRMAATTLGQVAAELTLPSGHHVLTVVATDAAGHAGSSEVAIEVTDGAWIDQPVVDVSPAAPVTGNTLRATLVEAPADPDLTWIWAWNRDGADAGITGPIVPGSDVVYGERWDVTVYAFDGTHVSRPATAWVEVGNAAPDPGSVTLSPADATVDDDLVCAHDAVTDAEGDAFTVAYGWTIDGAELAWGEAVLPAGTALRGQEVRCFVELDDGVLTVEASNTVAVANSPPVVTAVAVTPLAPTEASTVRCLASGVSDADGDPVVLAYRWTTAAGEVGATPELTGAAFAHGDELVCTVTPQDPYEDGAAVAAAPVRVGNTLPTAPLVAFVDPEVVAGETAVCTVTRASTDLDGDRVRYTWTWSVNGAAAAGSAGTFDTTGLVGGEVLTCTATPSDGFGNGPSASDSTVLRAPTSGDVTDSDAFITLSGSYADGVFGKALATLGDADGDGLTELVVTAPAAGADGEGIAYVFAGWQLAAGGSLEGDDAAWAYAGADSADQFGAARGAAAIGDLDDDGVSDLLLGGPGSDAGGADGGAAWILYGGETSAWGAPVDTVAELVVVGSADALVGVRAAGGDLDGDGLDDLFVAAPGAGGSGHGDDDDGDAGGAVGIWWSTGTRWSGTLALDDADALLTGAAGDAVGWALVYSPDLDGDGYAELAISAEGDDTNARNAGAAALVSGSARPAGSVALTDAAFARLLGDSAREYFGFDLAAPGDLDGDGLADLAVGGAVSEGSGSDPGRACVWFGSTGLAGDTDASTTTCLEGPSGGDQLGGVLGAAGDFDGDGLADLLLGASRATGAARTSGLAWLLAGADTAAWAADGLDAARVRFVGAAAADQLGGGFAGGLVLDGDRYADIAVTAAGAGEDDVGRVYVYAGP